MREGKREGKNSPCEGGRDGIKERNEGVSACVLKGGGMQNRWSDDEAEDL
jgi:hypothetical protein